MFPLMVGAYSIQSADALHPCDTLYGHPLGFETFLGKCESGEVHPIEETHRTRMAELMWKPYLDLKSHVSAVLSICGKHRMGMFMGTSTGGLDATEAAFRIYKNKGALPGSYGITTQHDFYAATKYYKNHFGITGPSHVVSTACSSSGKVFGDAACMINAGIIDAAVVGGADALCHMTVRGFRGLGILSSERCRPFGKDRDGINIGEGCAMVLLLKPELYQQCYQKKNGVMLLGVGESQDAYHMSSPNPDGSGAMASMSRALAHASMRGEQLGYINAHGTATKQNDAAEAKAISLLCGSNVAVGSTKGYTGHALGAAAALEAVKCIQALETQTVLASLGSEAVDPELPDINWVHSNQKLQQPFVLSNSFAFGGSNVSLLFGDART